MAYPVSSFIISLYKQYQQRGSLSKKQLIGLHAKASGIESYQPGKLATLQALINRMPNRFKSEIPELVDPVEKQDPALQLISCILSRYPEHKRVLFLQAKCLNGESLQPAEISDLERLIKILKIETDKKSG